MLCFVDSQGGQPVSEQKQRRYGFWGSGGGEGRGGKVMEEEEGRETGVSMLNK